MNVIARQALLIANKDMRQFFKDRFAGAFALAFPLLFVFAFSLALGGVDPGDDQLSLTVAIREGDQLGALLMEGIASAPESGIAVLGYDEAQAAVADGFIDGFVAFQGTLDEQAQSGGFVPIQVVTATDNLSTALALQGLARDLTARIGAIGLAIQTAYIVGGPLAVDAGAIEATARREPILTFARQQVAEIKSFNASDLALPGYLTMFVFLTAAISAEGVARERQNHTLERLISNGTRRESILLGKFLSSLYRGGLQLAVMWLVGLLLFQIDLGASPLAVIVVSMLMVVASSAFGVMLATVVKSVRATASAGVLASLTLAPIGGSWWPLFIAPEWQQQLAKFTPHGWANDAFNKLMLFGAEGSDVFMNMAALAGFAIVFATVAVGRFRTAPAA